MFSKLYQATKNISDSERIEFRSKSNYYTHKNKTLIDTYSLADHYVLFGGENES